MLASSFCAVSLANAGFLDLLRGESSPRRASFQKVAFVGSARVKEVQGQAEWLMGVDVWKPLEKGVELAPGDMIRTRQGAIVLRMHESGSFVKVTANTLLRLVPMDEGWDRSVLSGREEKEGFVVRSCRGKATVRAPGQEPKNVEVNTVLAEGAEVWTDSGAVVDLFDNKKQRPVRIKGSARVKLHESAVASRVLVRPELVATMGP